MSARVLLAFNLHQWLMDFGLYRSLVYADWFYPLRATWIEYHLAWVLVSVLAILGFLILRAVFRAVGAVGLRARTSSRAMQARDLRLAEEFSKQGDWIQAAEAYERAGKPQKALAIYVQDQRWASAGKAAEELGDFEQAIEHLERAKDGNGVVRVLCRMGKYLDAARRCRADNRVVDGAKLLLDAGLLDQAALYYSEAGLFGKAASLWLELGDKARHVEALLNLIHQAHAGFTDDEAAQLRQGSAVLKKMGRLEESAMMLEASGELEGAALRYEEAGDRQRAADCFAKAGRFSRALKVCDDPLLRQEILRRAREAGDEQEVDWAGMQARQIHLTDLGQGQALPRDEDGLDLSGEEPLEVANRLAQEGLHAEAAEAFREAGELNFARQQFLLAGELDSAIEVAEQAGDFFSAGKIHFDRGDWAQAVDRLQQVPVKHVDARSVASLLARSFEPMGDREMARRMHDKATADLEMGRENLELFYQQARFLEAGDAAERGAARVVYARILEVHYGYKDSKSRYDDLGGA